MRSEILLRKGYKATHVFQFHTSHKCFRATVQCKFIDYHAMQATCIWNRANTCLCMLQMYLATPPQQFYSISLELVDNLFVLVKPLICSLLFSLLRIVHERVEGKCLEDLIKCTPSRNAQQLGGVRTTHIISNMLRMMGKYHDAHTHTHHCRMSKNVCIHVHMYPYM